MLYAQYSEGFKSGVILVGSSDPAAEPELVDSIEVGLKAQLLNNRLRANLAGFTYDYKDLQVTQLLIGAAVPTITNAASASIHGFEMEITALLTDRLRVDFKGGYLDATFDEFVSRNPRVAPPNPSPEIDLSGNGMPYAPDFSMDAHVEYRLPTGALEDTFTLTAMADITWTDGLFFSVFNDADLAQSSTAILDAALKFEAPGGRWSFSVWGIGATAHLWRLSFG